MSLKIQIEMVSDLVCPWCWVGLRRLKAAIELVPHIETQIVFRPYYLDPSVPAQGIDYKTYMKNKFGNDIEDAAKSASKNRWAQMRSALEEYGAAEGIPFDFAKMNIRPNTTNAHRLVHWAQGQGKGIAVKEALFAAYFRDHRDIGNICILTDIAGEIGLDKTIVADLFASDADTDTIVREAALFTAMGVRGVPCFIGDRKIAVQGAESAEKLAELIRATAAQSNRALQSQHQIDR